MARKLGAWRERPEVARTQSRAHIVDVIGRNVRRVVENSLLRNSGFILGTTLATSGLGYIYWTAAARTYPAEAVGLASALISAVNLVSTLAVFGLQAAVIDLLPRERLARSWSMMVNAALVMVMLTGLIFGIGLWLVLPQVSAHLLLPGNGLVNVGLLVGLVTTWNVVTVLDGVFIADRATQYLFSRNVIFSVTKIPLLLLPLLLSLMHRSAASILFSWLVATALSLLISVMWFLPRLGHVRLIDVRALWRKGRLLTTRMAGNSLIILSGTLPVYLLPVIVATRLTTTDSAYFYTTWMVGGIFFTISSSVSAALFAEGSAQRNRLSIQLRTSIRITALSIVPVGGGLLIFGRLIIGVFGPSYAVNGAALLSILVIAAIPDGITNLAVSVWRVNGRTFVAGLLNLGMSLMTLVLAWFLVPAFGVTGAGWAWLAGEASGSVVVLAALLLGRSHGRHWATRDENSERPLVAPRGASHRPTSAHDDD